MPCLWYQWTKMGDEKPWDRYNKSPICIMICPCPPGKFVAGDTYFVDFVERLGRQNRGDYREVGRRWQGELMFGGEIMAKHDFREDTGKSSTKNIYSFPNIFTRYLFQDP